MKRRFTSLKGKKNIDHLFQKGLSFFLYPFKVVYLIEQTKDLPRLMVVVPKKKIRKAVQRNLIRRRIKEALHIHFKDIFLSEKECLDTKNQLSEAQEKGETTLHLEEKSKKNALCIAFIYVANQPLLFHKLSPTLRVCVQRMLKKLENNS